MIQFAVLKHRHFLALQLDFSNAFAQADIPESQTVYIEPPHEFTSKKWR